MHDLKAGKLQAISERITNCAVWAFHKLKNTKGECICRSNRTTVRAFLLRPIEVDPAVFTAEMLLPRPVWAMASSPAF